MAYIVAPRPRAWAAAVQVEETAGGPQEKLRLGSRVTAPTTALFSGRKLHGKRGRAGDPESGHGPCRA
ncbi:hypothetical protein NDU88_001642 [Pleurodeles waltl]|uniref:Uncharacterized protein n=1 Tax=Pleurodeles waltl TaxID=8319 RepID=A0AAV7ND22_PLEWA|nr:hypothetical protein NDU88_001642 [Pleurodeles waltl]